MKTLDEICTIANDSAFEKRQRSSITILVWRFQDAPTKLKALSGHGGDEDWVALVPPNYKHSIPWLEYGTFGVCDISRHETEDGTVYIGAHA